MSAAKIFLAVKKHPFNLLYLALVGQLNTVISNIKKSLTVKATKLAYTVSQLVWNRSQCMQPAPDTRARDDIGTFNNLIFNLNNNPVNYVSR